MIAFRVTILGKPVSKNEGQRVNPYGISYVTPAVRGFQIRVRAAIREEAAKAGWPDDPFRVDHVVYSIYKFNMNYDHDAGNTYIADAFQYQRIRTKTVKETDFYGLVGNDKVLSLGESPKPQFDDGPTRIEIKVELRGLVSELEAADLRESWKTAEARRQEKRRKKDRAARAKRKDQSKK